MAPPKKHRHPRTVQISDAMWDRVMEESESLSHPKLGRVSGSDVINIALKLMFPEKKD